VDEIVEGCRILAEALDLGADFVVAQKGAAVIELIGMASAFVADQAASAMTFGIAEAGAPLIIEGAKALMETLKQQIIQYLVGEIVQTAAKPLFAKVENALSGLGRTPLAGNPGWARGSRPKPAPWRHTRRYCGGMRRR
jgi:hypothetical protein